MTLLRYVLITPARNEAAFIGRVIESVAQQTVRPIKWVIVNDGSTDSTAEIVRKYAAEHPWMELVQMPAGEQRSFAKKVHAFNAGYAKVRGLDYDAIGSLDADITFGPDYFEFLLAKLAENPRLGLVGTPFTEEEIAYDYRFVSIEHVSGACQLFRRECFEEIGGYQPVKGGGIDHIAVLTARMKGWQTRTFTEKICEHHRKMGTAERSLTAAKFADGKLDYALGGHPLWEVVRSLYQMTQKPVVIGGLMVFAGYFWSALRRPARPISEEVVRFRRNEQMKRLRKFVFRSA